MSAKPATSMMTRPELDGLEVDCNETSVILKTPDVRRLLATIRAHDAELARLRAAVPADVAETIRDLYSRANALTVQVPGMTITALTMREAAHALESLAAENARLKASVPADVAGLVKRLHGIGYMSSTAIDAADALESQARELAAKDEALRLEVAKRVELGAELCRRSFDDGELGSVVVMSDVEEVCLDPNGLAILEELAAKDERIAKLEAAMRYATHSRYCGDVDGGCDCGYSAALAQLDEVASGKEKPAPPAATKKRACNRHDDCDAADDAEKAHNRKAVHCWIEDCEDCFGC